MTELLESSRLVTLTGPPGIGKSRLGLELARQLGADDLDCTWLVELAPVRDAKLVPKALAAALSVQEMPGESLTDSVVAHLGARRVLVVLDNCEHLVEACAEVVDVLLRGCPELRILTTSREPLSIAGERVWQVPPLSVPGPDVSPVAERLMAYDAVSLFVERAGAVHPAFSLNADAAPAVAEISRRLDGIPLAIELAAARVATLTPSEIARRLDDRFSLLVRGARNHVSRHHTLQAAVDWSHELLSAAERALLRRMSVFVGGYCLEAAEAVCSGEEVERSEVLDLLSRLVSKSLVVADTANSRGRYHLLETIRAYATDKLAEADEQTALGDAHARFYLALAEEAEPELTGPRQQQWLERLDSDRDNLRSAIEWSLGQGQAERALRLAGALVLFWRVRCHFTEGRDLLDRVLSDSDGEAPGLRATALWGAGFLTMMAGDPDRAAVSLEESLAIFRGAEDPKGAARALLILCNCKRYRDAPEALRAAGESAALAREAGDTWCLAHALGVAGGEHMFHGKFPAARPLLEEGLAVARAAEDKQGLRFGLHGLGLVALAQGDYASAESLLKEALTLARELGENLFQAAVAEGLGQLALGRGEYTRARAQLEEALALLPEPAPFAAGIGSHLLLATVAHAEGDRPGAHRLFEHARNVGSPAVVWTWQGMGELAADEGDFDSARRLFEEALERARAADGDQNKADALHGLGRLARATKDLNRAVALHNDALQLQRRMGAAPGMVTSLEAMAGLAAVAGGHHHAARLLGAAAALREGRGYARPPWESSRYEHDVALVREGLSPDEFDAAWAQGARLSLEQAVTQACKGRRRRGRPASGWESLTETEQHVATLVAEGLTNPEIAQRLFVTTGTVKNHVSHIFAKLGLARRSELSQQLRRHRAKPSENGFEAPAKESSGA